MRRFFAKIRERWDNWTGDREMETLIRRQLSESGYHGRTAKLKAVRLVAVKRPGWLQVFRFEASVRRAVNNQEDSFPPAPVYEELYGLVRLDARYQTVVKLFVTPDERKQQFAQWAEGLHCLRGSHGLRQ